MTGESMTTVISFAESPFDFPQLEVTQAATTDDTTEIELSDLTTDKRQSALPIGGGSSSVYSASFNFVNSIVGAGTNLLFFLLNTNWWPINKLLQVS